MFEKDVLKDVLYQTLGFGDKDWSRRIGISAISLLLLIAVRMLQTGTSLVTESNFYTRLSSEWVNEIVGSIGVRVVQVHCSAPSNVLLARNTARLEPSELRPGHHVMPSDELLEGISSGAWEPLKVPSKIIRVDTADTFDYAEVLQSIR